MAEMYLLSRMLNVSSPLVHARLEVNALKSRSAVASCALVSGVLGLCGFSQVVDSVVVAKPVDVVNGIARPPSMDIKEGKAVLFVCPSVY